MRRPCDNQLQALAVSRSRRRDQALAVCHTSGAGEIGDFRASSLNTLIQMVAGGIGITLLPRLSLEVEAPQPSRIVILPFRKPEPSRTIGLVWRTTSPRAHEFQLLAELLVPQPGPVLVTQLDWCQSYSGTSSLNTRAAFRPRIFSRLASDKVSIWRSMLAAEYGQLPSWCG